MVAGWRSGQLLDATVTAVPAADTLVLKVGAAVLLAKGAGLPELSIGASIKLEVLATSGTITLKLLTTPQTTPAPATAEPLRMWLPKQSSLAPLLANLSAFTNSPSPLAPAVNAVRQFLTMLPTVSEVTHPAKLATAIADSGVFLETKLHQAATSASISPALAQQLKQDFKQSLLTLASELERATPHTARANTPPSQALPTTLPSPSAQPRTVDTDKNRAGAPQVFLRKEELTTAIELKPTTSNTTEARSPAAALPSPLARTTQDLPAPLKGMPLLAQPRAAAELMPAVSMPALLRDLHQQVEGSIARLTATQLTHTTSNDTLTPWHITCELPVRRDEKNVDVIGVRIAEEGNRDKDPAKRRFTITLSFDFPETGPFYAQVRLFDKLVSCSFHAEQTRTAELVQRELSRLANELGRVGLKIGDLNAQVGSPTHTARRYSITPLVDTNA